MSAIETHELTRWFSSGVAVDRVTLSLPAGEVLALLGPNGAGKTTTVRLLNGVLVADHGEARVLGLDPVAAGDAVRRQTGVLTENAGLDDRLTTRENLMFTARLRGFSATGAQKRVDVLLERFGMASRADDLTQGFSTGQRKRVALARALLHDPELLFLDEPTSGLDPAGTRDVIDLIRGLASEGRTIVLATHFLGEAGRLATQMAVLHRGQLRAYGDPESLAGQFFDGIGAELDFGGSADAPTLAWLRDAPGVLRAQASAVGARLQVSDREIVPHVVEAIVARGIPVYGVSASAPSLEDVYFEIERRILAETGDHTVTDGFAVNDPASATVHQSLEPVEARP
jgi:ABC-2 type transport system ATP-binding protein